MADQNPGIQHLRRSDYQTKPWKNGKGQTHDILLSPKGADHSNFDLRFALSPIVEEGPFSSYPGADRVINLIEGTALELAFEESDVRLENLQSLFFDTGLAPIGKPIGGPVRVVNVMARRGVWDIATYDFQSELTISCTDDDLLFIYAVSEACVVTVDGVDSRVEPTDSLFVSGAAKIMAASEGHMLVAQLTRSAGPISTERLT